MAAGAEGSGGSGSGPCRPFDNGNPYDLGTFQGTWCASEMFGLISMRSWRPPKRLPATPIDRKSSERVNSPTPITHDL
jgi:hypothetical protein